MKLARRGKLSAAQRAESEKGWKAGQSLNEIGRALGKPHVVIQFLSVHHDGILPFIRRRSLPTLPLTEREDKGSTASGVTGRTAILRHLRFRVSETLKMSAISRIGEPKAIAGECASLRLSKGA